MSARLAALAVALIAAVAAGSALARPDSASIDFRDARYCEVLELRGELPGARVLVWNTIGFSDCPEPKFESLDPAALAEASGAALVLVNGPRHFLMDSAAARVSPRVLSFGGMRMSRVARIPVDDASDLVQTPYVERLIERVNTWSWNRGRRVHELIDPGGATYIMQSYSQIRDPDLELRDLRRLGERLSLPEGWRYRTRRLREELTLGARGQATIVQDDLLNTYQRAPRRLVP